MKDKPTGNGGIYEIANRVNGKRYIGSAAYFNKRWSQHRHQLRRGTHHCAHLQRAWTKYGESEFVFRVLEIVSPPTREALVEREQWHFNSAVDSYNTAPIAGSRAGVKHSPETIAKLKRHWNGYWEARPEAFAQREQARLAALKAPDVVARLSASRRLVVRTDEWRAAISQASADRHATDPGQLDSARGMREFPIRLDTRQKMSLAKIGKTLSEEHRAKIGEALRGVPRHAYGPEFRAKVSAATVGRPANSGSFAPGLVPWNKGIPSGVVPPNKGVAASPEVAARLRAQASQPGHKGRAFTDEQRAEMSAKKRVYSDEEIRQRRREQVAACRARKKARDSAAA